jgi:ABC-2 type transport system permease protein
VTTIAPALPRRPRRVVNDLSVLAAFIRKDWTIAWSYRMPFVLGLGQSLTTVGFLYFLGRLVGRRIDTASQGLHGGYFPYAILGTALLGFFSVTLVTFAQRLRTDQTTGTLEVLFTMPPGASLTVIASAAYTLLFSVVTSVVTLAFAVGLGMRLTVTAAGALLAVGSLVVSIAFAAFVIVFKRGETLTGLGVSALSLVGGVYYPISLLPHALRMLADVLPFTWALEVLRDSLLSTSLPFVRFGELCAATTVAVPLALRLFSAALNRARRSGTLGQY